MSTITLSYEAAVLLFALIIFTAICLGYTLGDFAARRDLRVKDWKYGHAYRH